MSETIIKNKIKCRNCGFVIESLYRHDFKGCRCGSIHVDGGKDYLRRVGNLENIIDISEVKDGDRTPSNTKRKCIQKQSV